MTTQTEKDLRKLEKGLLKLRNNLKRADLDFTVQASINSTNPHVVIYAASMTAPAAGLAPLTFIASSTEALYEKIKAAQKHIDYDAVELAYHEAQIQSCNKTIEGHQDRIDELKNQEREEETVDATEEES